MMSLDIYIVMEWYPTDLEYQLNSPHFKLEEYSIRVVFYELLIGLQQIHVRTQMLLGIGCCRPACVHLRVACEQVIHQSCIPRRSITDPSHLSYAISRPSLSCHARRALAVVRRAAPRLETGKEDTGGAA